MAIYRPVHVTFWQDPKVIEEMTPEDKLFYLYLITNPKTTQIGIYQITKKQISFELGYSIESINALMDRFENHHKIIKYNPVTRELAMKNWGKYNFPRAGTPIENCVKKELSDVKDKELIKFVAEKVENKKIKDIFDSELYGHRDELRDELRDEGNNNHNHNNNNNNNNNHNDIETKNMVVVVDKIKSYFLLDDNDIKKVADVFAATNKSIDYLEEKLKLTKNNPNTRDVVGYLISALKNDYKSSINDYKCFIPQIRTRLHNFNERGINYTPEELEKILKENQKGKFN